MKSTNFQTTDVASSKLLETAQNASVPSTIRFPPLEQIARPSVETSAAAYYLNRREQTLRLWACKENGPIRPFRINGRLHWSVAELRRLLEVK